MNITLEELRPVIDAWRWTGEPSSQLALLVLGAVMVLASGLVYGPLLIKWAQVARLDRELARLAKGTTASRPGQLAHWSQAFQGSPAESQWNELQKRWREQRDGAEPGMALEPAPLSRILKRWPLLPYGMRRTALDSLPGGLMLLGVMGAVLSLSVLLSKASSHEGSPLMSGLGPVVLSAPLWGLTLALVAGFASRLFHGIFDYYSESLDRRTWVALTAFAHENAREAKPRFAGSTAERQREIPDAPEVESTHLAHLQLNKVTQQMASLIEHLHESGFALRNAASALASTQGRIENNSEEIRISLKQAASTVVDQGGFIQMSLDQIRTALDRPELAQSHRRVSNEPPASAELTLERSRETEPERLPSSAGRRLGPDPYARAEARETDDAKSVQRLLEKHQESKNHTQPIPAARLKARSKEVPGKLSDLLAQTTETKAGTHRPIANSSARPKPRTTAGTGPPPRNTASAGNSNE